MNMTRAVSEACSVGSCSGCLSSLAVVVLITQSVSQVEHHVEKLKTFLLQIVSFFIKWKIIM